MRLTKRAGFSLFTLAYAVGGIALAVEMTGGAWDIEWHIAQLVEVFWTPPHTVLYVGLGFVAVAAFAGLLLRFVAPRPPRALEIGLQVVAVGVLLQFVAGGFDEWWHGAFGVDDALSPPHVLLIAGMITAGVGLVLGLTRLLRAEDFLTHVAAGARRLASAALPLAFVGLHFALFGFAFVFTYPGFALDPFVGELWKRGLIVFVFASLIPFTAVAAARSVPWPGGATAVLVVATVSFYTVAGLMGDLVTLTAADLPLFILGIVVFLIPGIAVDLVLARPWKGASLLVAVGLLGVLGGLLSLVQGGAVLNMTGGLEANPLWFLALYALGGVVGGLIGLAFANALQVERVERVATPAVTG
ncbi:MAG: hypothetical protein ACE5KQ_06630 [Thermoplasmata archaeon]